VEEVIREGAQPVAAGCGGVASVGAPIGGLVPSRRSISMIFFFAQIHLFCSLLCSVFAKSALKVTRPVKKSVLLP
jgi:predicted MFS family arabinose efflux permease